VGLLKVWLRKHFEKGNVKLQVALKSPILDPVVTYENNVRSDGKFQMHFGKSIQTLFLSLTVLFSQDK